MEALLRIMPRTCRAGYLVSCGVKEQRRHVRGTLDKYSHFRVVISKGFNVTMAPTVRDNAARQIEIKTEKRLKLWPDMHDPFRTNVNILRGSEAREQLTSEDLGTGAFVFESIYLGYAIFAV